jgi:tetratricopeptide (TPR) repeat protein
MFMAMATPMQSTVRSTISTFTLTQLAANLAKGLHQIPDLPKGLKIRGATNRGKLLILSEHTADVAIPSEYLFAHLEQCLRQQFETVGLPEEAYSLTRNQEELLTQFYLKRAEEPKPYAFHRFIWSLSDGFDAVFGHTPIETVRPETFEPVFVESIVLEPLQPDTQPETIDLTSPTLGAAYATTAIEPDETSDKTPDKTPDELAFEHPDHALDRQINELWADSFELGDFYGPNSHEAVSHHGGDHHPLHEPLQESLHEALDHGTFNPVDLSPEVIGMTPEPTEIPDIPIGDIDFQDPSLQHSDIPEIAAVDEAEVLSQDPKGRRLVWGKWQGRHLVETGLAVILIGSVGYLVSRPCLFGSCDRITQAQALSRAAYLELSDEPSVPTVLAMRDQLNRAAQKLKPIPFWSPYHRQSEPLLQEYQQEVVAIDKVINAQKGATEAANDSLSPPHPIQHWQQVAAQWQAAIVLLEGIPKDSALHAALIAPKLSEYRANLATIEGRIKAEQTAEQSVNQALQSALLATKQTEIAASLPNWETALKSWQTAVNDLKKIPQGTLAYGEARKLLPEYEAKLAEVNTRTRQERVAEQFYNEAIRFAAEARQYESKNQWTLAMMHWRDAVTQIKGIPVGTARAKEGQNLLKTYQPSLEKAQENLRLALRFQKVEQTFAETCGVAPRLCTYALQGAKVRLTLSAGYDEAIELSITPPPQRVTNPAVTEQTAAIANQLLAEITNLGKRTQLPIELYDAKGGFIAKYQPDLDGYVKH